MDPDQLPRTNALGISGLYGHMVLTVYTKTEAKLSPLDSVQHSHSRATPVIPDQNLHYNN